MSDSSRVKAAKELGVPVEATPEKLREAFFKQLANNQFVPTEKQLASVALLNGPKLPMTPGAHDLLSNYDIADVDDFIESYWSLDPQSRFQRWTELRNQCKNPLAIDRLYCVEDGLKIEVKKQAVESQNDLARTIRELFLLETRAQTARRLDWLASPEAESLTVEDARQLQVTEPKLCDLEPQLFHFLLKPKRPPTSVEPMSDEAFAKMEEEVKKKAAKDYQRALDQQAKHASGDESQGQNPAKLLLFIPLLVMILRGCMAMTSNSESNHQNNYPPPMKYSNPNADLFEKFNLRERQSTTEDLIRSSQNNEPKAGLSDARGPLIKESKIKESNSDKLEIYKTPSTKR